MGMSGGDPVPGAGDLCTVEPARDLCACLACCRYAYVPESSMITTIMF